MQRHSILTLGALLALTASAWAGPLGCLGCPGGDCKPIPCPTCPDCSCPCERRLPLNLFGNCHVEALIEQLHTGDCCERIEAARKLGNRFHADFCSQPCVLSALAQALHCDPCWEVRRAAAWSIGLQGARTEEGVLALYVQSKVDPHYMVRVRAAEALDIMTLCRQDCFKCVYEQGDALVKELKKAKYAPGSCDCGAIFGSCGAAPIMMAPVPTPTPTPAKTGQLPGIPEFGHPLPIGQ